MDDYSLFASICANSTTYMNLKDTLYLKDSITDIKDLFEKRYAIVGALKNNRKKLIRIQLFQKTDYSIFSAKCDGLHFWIQSSNNDIETLAWVYIDLLSMVVYNLNARYEALATTKCDFEN